MKIGEQVLGSTVYGKHNTLTGKIVAIEHNDDDGHYILNDVVTVAWDNGTTAKFHLKDI